jgi:hypothetical protein
MPLPDRILLDDLQHESSFTTLLQPSEELGSSLTEALRVYSDEPAENDLEGVRALAHVTATGNCRTCAPPGSFTRNQTT